jgi:hypothetical protein
VPQIVAATSLISFILNSVTGFELILCSEVQGFCFRPETGVFLTETTQLDIKKKHEIFFYNKAAVGSVLPWFYTVMLLMVLKTKFHRVCF